MTIRVINLIYIQVVSLLRFLVRFEALKLLGRDLES